MLNKGRYIFNFSTNHFMKIRLSICLGLFLFLSNSVQSQEVLTVDDAIKIALEKNYSVLIVKGQQDITKAQNNFGNAGMSPTITLNANYNLANLNSYQEFATGATQEINGAKSKGMGASINMSWTVFDGLRMFAIKKRLEINEEYSAIALKKQMENTIFEIIVAYYDMVRFKELIKAEKQNLSIYTERRKISEMKYEIGSASKVDLLLSQTDENKAKGSIIQLELSLLTARAAFNTLLTRPVDTEFVTADSIVVYFDPDLSELKKGALTNNSTILLSKQNEFMLQQSVKEVRANNIPFLQVNGSYLLNQSQNQAGFLFKNQQTGLNAGLTANWLIFNGGKNSRLVKERNIQVMNQRLFTDQTVLNMDAQVYVTYQAFQLNKQIANMERQNLKDTKEVLTISLERYRSGKSDLMETILSQKYLEDTQVRLINALYAMKVSETELLRVNGSLLK
jgi:outer membrane protein